LLNSAFFWSYAFLQIPAGWIVDRYGVKYPYAIAFFAWSLISAATAMGNTLTQLIGLRFLLGVAESIVTPASMHVVHRFMSSSQCARPRERTDMNWVFHRLPWALPPPLSSQDSAPSVGRSHPQHTTISEVHGRTREWHMRIFTAVHKNSPLSAALPT